MKTINDYDLENLQPKVEISEAAARLYVNQNGSFSFHDIAEETKLNVGRIFRYFSKKDEIIQFYYTSLIIRYRLMIEEIDDFATFTLSEKLSNFAYASFDMMDERRDFVDQTYRSHIMRSCRTTYENEIEALFSDFFESDSGKSASSDLFLNDCSLAILRRKYLLLVLVWLNDTSDGKEMSLELTDKVTGLIQELAYTSVVDRTVDLVKFLYTNNVLETQFPWVRKFSSTFEIH